jgi:hypothetical protein
VKILILCLLLSINACGQIIYTSEIALPSFSFLSANGHCYSNEDLSLFNDTTLSFDLISQGREGVLYFAYSSLFGGVSDVQYEQVYQGESIAFDNYVFLGLTDTIQVNITITGVRIESFCPFFLPLNALSVTFGQITCYQYGNYVIATCQTLSETNSHRIELYVSADLISWQFLGAKQTSVNSSNQNTYRFKSDRIEASGIYYAKFVEVDLNGETMESQIIPFEFKAIENYTKKYDLAGRLLE